MEKYVCTGCSCLCDDVVIKDKIYHACRKGVKYFRKERESAKIKNKEVKVDDAIKEAVKILKESKKIAFFGMDHITNQAQEEVLKLAKSFGAIVDDFSSILGGSLIEFSLKLQKLQKTTLEDVRDNAYVIVYWGANPHQSMPRHMSRYTYYPRSGKRQRGYEEDRYLVVVDVRMSETAKLAKMAKKGSFIMGNDLDVIDSFIKATEGKVGKFSEAAKILKEMQKAELNVIFGGSGLEFGINKDFSKFTEMFEKLNETTKVVFIPCIPSSNMRGFNEKMLKNTGYVNSYDFSTNSNKKFFEAEEIDTFVIISSDPIKSLPYRIAEFLKDRKIILINAQKSLTSKFADVVIPAEISPFVRGSFTRQDGVEIPLTGISENSDENIIKRIFELV